MGSFVRQHPASLLFSIALHTAIASMFVLGFEFSGSPRAMAPPQTAIQARVVDSAAIEREVQRLAEAERAKIAQAEREEREARDAADAARREREREQQRLADVQRERETAERVEQQRQEQLRVQREKEAADQRAREVAAEKETQRLAELQREREAEERRQAEAERQRRAEEERRRLQAEAEARKQAELEAELSRALAAENDRRRAEEAGLLDQYLRAIQSQIERNWIAPPTARPGLVCVINVTQIPSGDVVGVGFGSCNGDEAVKRSIEAAVLRASPLPRPPVPALFNRSLEVTFRPEV
jgi:colicin import membrane protein